MPEKREAGAGYRWVQVTGKAAFAPRDGAGALTFRGRMWLLGGWNPRDKVFFPKICNNEVWSSTDGATWRLEKPNSYTEADFDPARDWAGRHTAGYAVFKDRMWIVGGDANQGYSQSDVWSSSDGVRWERAVERVPWAPRVLHYTLAFEDRLWILGGQTLPQFAPEKEVFYGDVWNSADGVHWERIEPRSPRWENRGMIGGSAVFQDRMWILGGGTYETPQIPRRKFFDDVWSSSDGEHWECHTEHAPWTGRQYHDVAVFDGKMWVMEGCYNEAATRSMDLAKGSWNRNDVWYSEDGATWHELPGTPWAPRHAASVFVYDDALWMVAGNNMESDVWRLERCTAG